LGKLFSLKNFRKLVHLRLKVQMLHLVVVVAGMMMMTGEVCMIQHRLE
jgi:hypothetical protein